VCFLQLFIAYIVQAVIAKNHVSLVLYTIFFKFVLHPLNFRSMFDNKFCSIMKFLQAVLAEVALGLILCRWHLTLLRRQISSV
jgi:hypothetical protein